MIEPVPGIATALWRAAVLSLEVWPVHADSHTQPPAGSTPYAPCLTPFESIDSRLLQLLAPFIVPAAPVAPLGRTHNYHTPSCIAAALPRCVLLASAKLSISVASKMQASCSAPLAAARRLPALPARAAQLRSAPVSKAVQQAEAGTSSSQIGKASEGEEIYIGFKKEDGFGDRTGRKGRVIKDDPRKYPGREDMGPFLSVVGGWAGGEVGLWQIREEAKKELEAKQAPAKSKSDKPTVIRSGNGKDEIYIGFQKEDGFGDRTGRKGRVVIDDARKYPGKEVCCSAVPRPSLPD